MRGRARSPRGPPARGLAGTPAPHPTPARRPRRSLRSGPAGPGPPPAVPARGHPPRPPGPLPRRPGAGPPHPFILRPGPGAGRPSPGLTYARSPPALPARPSPPPYGSPGMWAGPGAASAYLSAAFSPLLPPRFLGPADGCECEALAMDAEARRRCCRSPLGSGASLSLSGERGEDHIFILETEKCSRGRRS